jgi:hypothetical protein
VGFVESMAQAQELEAGGLVQGLQAKGFRVLVLHL